MTFRLLVFVKLFSGFFQFLYPVLTKVFSLYLTESKFEFCRLQKTQVTESSSTPLSNHGYFSNQWCWNKECFSLNENLKVLGGWCG